MSEVLVRDSVSDDTRDEMQQLLDDPSVLSGDASSEEQRRAREAARQHLRAKAKSSLYFLVKGVLGYDQLTKRTHKPYADFIQDLSNKRTLDLLPRGTFKTTIGTIGFAIWYLLNNPNHFILLANQVAGHAERMLTEIEAHLDGGNAMMNWLFPEFIKPHPKYKPWTSNKMSVPCRTVKSGTPSITTIGVGGKAESMHFHVIIKDDLIGEKAMESEKEMSDAIAWNDYSESLFISPKNGIERMHGTRWSLGDLYSVVLRDPSYEFYIRAAEDPKTGELFFPELLDRETLRRIRQKNFAVYMSQYMNDPENPEVLDFKVEWLRMYKLFNDENKGPYCYLDGYRYYCKDMDIRMFVDPAGSGDVEYRVVEEAKRGRSRRANNAIGLVGAHPSGMRFLLEEWVGRTKDQNPELELARHMLEMFKRWKGYAFRGYVESYGAQRAIITVFDMLRLQEGEGFRLEEIGRGNSKAKKVRIRSYIGPYAQNGQLAVRAIHDQFIYEFSKYPQSDMFDTLDMMAWAMHTLRNPTSEIDAEMLAKQNKRQKLKLRARSKAGY